MTDAAGGPSPPADAASNAGAPPPIETIVPGLAAWLSDVARRQPAPKDAVREVARRRAACPGWRIDLAWERDEVSDTVAYTLILRGAGRVFALSGAPETSTPWPLRKATPLGADALVTVNGHTLRVGEAVPYVDLVLARANLLDDLVDLALVAAEVRHHDHEPDVAAVDAGVEAFFRSRGLPAEAGRRAWLDRRGIEAARLRGLVRDVLVRRAAEQALAGRVDATAYPPDDFCSVSMAVLHLPAEAVEAARHQLEAVPDGADLWTFATGLHADGATGLSIELVTGCRYEFAQAPIARAGPFVLDRGADGRARLIQELSRGEPPAGADLSRVVAKRQLAEAYRRLRAEASVTWHWGRPGSGLFRDV